MRRGGTAAETNVAEKKGKKTIKLLASSEQISPAAEMIFSHCLTFSPPLPAAQFVCLNSPRNFCGVSQTTPSAFLLK